MKKVFLSVLIFGDMVMIAACTFLMYKRLSSESSTSASQVPVVVTERSAAPSSSSVPTLAAFSNNATPVAAPSGPLSNVLFSYFNKKATRVAIMGDFTNWQPVFLERDPKGFWKHQAQLTSGEYGYYYEVDGKPLKDPLNKKTKKRQGLVISVHVVKTPPAPSTTPPTALKTSVQNVPAKTAAPAKSR